VKPAHHPAHFILGGGPNYGVYVAGAASGFHQHLGDLLDLLSGRRLELSRLHGLVWVTADFV
jgi:hypothetical protein